MQASAYQKLAMRTRNTDATEKMNNWQENRTGVEYKGDVIVNEEIDMEHLKKEIGDVCWYVAMLCEAMNFSLDEILQINIEKLKARYPEGFNTDRANNRSAADV